MTNKQIQLVLWFLIGSLLLCGGVYGWQQYQLLQNMKVAFVKAGSKITNLSLTNITLSLQLSFTNASAVDITVKDYNFDVSVNGNKIVTVTCAVITRQKGLLAGVAIPLIFKAFKR